MCNIILHRHEHPTIKVYYNLAISNVKNFTDLQTLFSYTVTQQGISMKYENIDKRLDTMLTFTLVHYHQATKSTKI